MENLEFQKRVKELRIKKGLSQEELANKSGISIRTIQRIENEETIPHGDTLRKILHVLQSLPDFSSITNEKNKQQNFSFNKLKTIFFDNWQKPLFLFFLSLVGFISGFAIRLMVFAQICFILLCTSLFALALSTIYQFRRKRWKAGIITILITIFALMVIIGIVGYFTPAKSIRLEETNGLTIKTEKNLITGKSVTTITTDTRDTIIQNYKPQNLNKILLELAK